MKRTVSAVLAGLLLAAVMEAAEEPTATLNVANAEISRQAGIVITHLDKRRISVTYNDALPLASREKK